MRGISTKKAHDSQPCTRSSLRAGAKEKRLHAGQTEHESRSLKQARRRASGLLTCCASAPATPPSCLIVSRSGSFVKGTGRFSVLSRENKALPRSRAVKKPARAEKAAGSLPRLFAHWIWGPDYSVTTGASAAMALTHSATARASPTVLYPPTQVATIWPLTAFRR